MKPKEYKKKYLSIERDGKLNAQEQDTFLEDFEADFVKALNICKNNLNLTRFKSLVKEIRSKWDSIFFGVIDEHEKLWKYFYATVVVPNREIFCGEEIKKNQAEFERKKKEWQQWREFTDPSYMWEQMFKERMNEYEQILKSLLANPRPIQSFNYFGYEEKSIDSITANDVIKKYKQMAITLHPDKGGETSSFQELAMHKERCVSFLEKR